MVSPITPEALFAFIEGDTPYACLDVREPEAYRWAHIPGASLMPERLLPDQVELAVPCCGIPVLIYDDEGHQAGRAAATLEGLGYRQVSVLAGGLKHWMARNYPIEWSLQPSGALSAPEFTAVDTDAHVTRADSGLSANPSSAPHAGGEPGIERWGQVPAWRRVQRQLASETDRFALLPSAPGRRAAAEACAARLAQHEAIRSLDIPTVQALVDRHDCEPVYLIDVRTADEHRNGHIPGFRWFPMYPMRPYADEAVVMQHCPIVFCCDGKARAAMAASWFAQIVCAEISMVDGGVPTWEAWGLPLERDS